MCDQYDNRGCEVVDEKDMIITDLELEIDNLNQRIKELEELCGPITLAEEGLTDIEIYNAWCDY